MRSTSAQRAIDWARDERAKRMVDADLDARKHTVEALQRAHGIPNPSRWRDPQYGMLRLHWWERIWHGVRLGFD